MPRSPLRIFVVPTLAALVATTASAAPVAPAKPSQIVTAFGGSGSTICSNSALTQVNTVMKPDGGLAPLVIPKGFVFVVTSFDWTESGIGTGRYGSALIAAVSPSGTPGAQATASAPTVADGSAMGIGLVPSGLVVKPPATLCVQFGGGSPSNALAVVHGFFTKDK